MLSRSRRKTRRIAPRRVVGQHACAVLRLQECCGAIEDARLGAAVIRYLAVAHFGRGRGDFAVSDPAPRWQAVVSATLARHAAERGTLWSGARQENASHARLDPVILALLAEVLTQLYPEPAAFFRGRLASTEQGESAVV